ncbi:MAG: hypothetical protein IIW14_01115 [Kiritimatiellae bacterium]|nr:hypothetical protein [Kiritimatiellia bacterium]
MNEGLFKRFDSGATATAAAVKTEAKSADIVMRKFLSRSVDFYGQTALGRKLAARTYRIRLVITRDGKYAIFINTFAHIIRRTVKKDVSKRIYRIRRCVELKDIAAVLGQSSYLGGYLTPVGEIGGVGAENRNLPRTLVNSCRSSLTLGC